MLALTQELKRRDTVTRTRQLSAGLAEEQARRRKATHSSFVKIILRFARAPVEAAKAAMIEKRIASAMCHLCVCVLCVRAGRRRGEWSAVRRLKGSKHLHGKEE